MMEAGDDELVATRLTEIMAAARVAATGEAEADLGDAAGGPRSCL